MSYETVIQQVKSVPERYLERISVFIADIQKEETHERKSIKTIFGILPDSASVEEAKEERIRKSL